MRHRTRVSSFVEIATVNLVCLLVCLLFGLVFFPCSLTKRLRACASFLLCFDRSGCDGSWILSKPTTDSFAGAVAQLFSFKLAGAGSSTDRLPRPVTCVTLGAPKVGSGGYRAAFEVRAIESEKRRRASRCSENQMK